MSIFWDLEKRTFTDVETGGEVKARSYYHPARNEMYIQILREQELQDDNTYVWRESAQPGVLHRLVHDRDLSYPGLLWYEVEELDDEWYSGQSQDIAAGLVRVTLGAQADWTGTFYERTAEVEVAATSKDWINQGF